MAVAAGVRAVPRPRSATYFGVALITLAQLMYEVGLTRIFSVTMWYHFAFVAISLALFGMTVGALAVHLRPHRFPEDRVREHLWIYSLLFAISVPVTLAIQLRLPFNPDVNLEGLGSVAIICLVIAVPFVFGGVVVCLALTRFPDRVNRLYAADLIGAAIGCVGFVLLLRVLDAPSAVLALGALGALAALCFARDDASHRGMLLAAVAVVSIGGLTLVNAALFHRGDAPVKVVWAKGERDTAHRYEAWNSLSRVVVDGDPIGLYTPTGYGMSSTMPKDVKTRQLNIVIDSAASTGVTHYDGNLDKTDYLRYDITNLAHYLRPGADVAVVGVGGGRDILSALEFEQRSVTGIEINPDILDITNRVYGDFTGNLDRNPKVRFVNDEARSFFARTQKKYDIIQISLIDTWAATSAGAFALSENSLYTTDAFDVFYDSLKPGGVLSVSRWYDFGWGKPFETYRSTVVAAQALKNRGVTNPRDHILIYHAPKNAFGVNVATLLISPQPFAPADLARIDKVTSEMRFTPVLTPTYAADEHFAGFTRPAGPGAEAAKFDEDLSPSTDSRPFFFQMADLDTILSGRVFHDDRITRPVLVLGMLGLAVILMALGLIVVPLLVTTRRSAHRGMASLYVYFAGIGLGFLLVELSQLQRLSIFLGHPVYALTVVLFTLLLASGIGSVLAGRFAGSARASRPVVPLVGLLVVLGLFSFVQQRGIDAFSSSTTPVRIAVAIALLTPLGLLMGMPFSIGMRTATGSRGDAPTAFLWGINGAASVCASVLGVVLAVLFGIPVAFWTGVAAYALATVSLVAATRARAPVPEQPDEYEAGAHEDLVVVD